VTEEDTGLKELYTPPVTDDANYPPIEYVTSLPPTCTNRLTENASIVAIHGIGAHPDDTWSKKVGSNEEAYVNWLSHDSMLPAVVPSARIMRYGYESAWFGCEAMSQSTSDIAQRLLLALGRKRKV
jgi:hypothetical protein